MANVTENNVFKYFIATEQRIFFLSSHPYDLSKTLICICEISFLWRLHQGGIHLEGLSGCSRIHFLGQGGRACLLSHFSCVRLFVTPWTVGCQTPLSMDSPGRNSGVGCHALLQGSFHTQGLNPCLLCLLHSQAGSLPLALGPRASGSYWLLAKSCSQIPVAAFSSLHCAGYMTVGIFKSSKRATLPSAD